MSDLIIKGHNSSSYFWIMPVKIKDITKDTNNSDNIEELRGYEISIEEENVFAFLLYYLEKYYDNDLVYNKNRHDIYPSKYSDGITSNFSWNLDYNFYTFETMNNMISEIKRDVEKLKNNYFDPSLEPIKNHLKHVFNDNIIEFPSPETKRSIIEFYEEFIEIIEKIINETTIDGYDLISFMGP